MSASAASAANGARAAAPNEEGETLRARVARFTTRPAAATDAEREPREVLLVPPGGDLAEGFARARALLREAGSVRLIGMGVTVRETWPAWVADEPGLWLTELGAYRYETSLEATAELRRAARAWLARQFDGVLPLPAADVFYTSAMIRFFQRALDARLYARGLAAHHADARLSTVDETWAGWPQIVGARERAGILARGAWAASLGAAALAFGAATAGHQIARYAASAASRTRLRELRASAPAETPRTWVTLVPDFARANRHVMDAIVLPELAAGRRFGIILTQSLAVGERTDANLRSSVGRALWPGLEPIRDRLGECVVEQAVGAETVLDLARDLAAAARATVRVTARLAIAPPKVDLGTFDFPLRPALRQLATLLTLDVARAVACHGATARILARHDFRGADVVMVNSGATDASPLDLGLQAAGARTIELCHGTASDLWHGAAEVTSRVRALWSNVDAALNAPLDKELVVAGMPRVIAAKPRAKQPRRVLILSSYVHRDQIVNGRYPFEPFMHELLGVSREIPALLGDRFEFRLRPHPADNAERIRAFLALYPRVALSRGTSLAEDVAWCDVLVSSQSSSIAEALFADVPIFLLALPHQRPPETRYVDARRRFFRAREMAEGLQAYLDGLARGDRDQMEMERRSRELLYGPSGEPQALRVVLRVQP